MKACTGLAGLGVAALSLFATTVSAQQSTRITGAPDGQVRPRLEIREMAASNPDQFNLFLLATQAFQNTSHQDVMGWYQLAGIHGMPYVPWNGVNGPNQGQGYCPHTMAIFICWHRAYTLAWEQQTLIQAQNVVDQFSGADRQRYQNALTDMRLPYWDWAEIPPSGNPADCMPDTLSSATVQVTTPSGPQTVANPLYAFYNMNPHDQSDFNIGGGDWDSWPNTLRYPTSQDVNAQSAEGSAVSNLGSNNPTARAQVYRVLTACPNFLDVSNDGVAEQNSNCGVSLEAIHNGIHTFTGGPTNSGHMTYNNFAAFDPIFYLHHANVDRIFALWQALNPGSYMPPTTSGQSSTFTINAGQAINASTPLEPFVDGTGKYFTCDSVRDVTSLRYTYPELQQGNVAAAVNGLYGSNAVAQSVSSSSSSSSTSSTSSSSASASRSASASNSASASGSNSASGSSSSVSATGSPTTITTTNAQGSTITTVSTPGAPGGGAGGATGSPTTITTTNAQGSTITTVSTPGAAAGGSTVTTTNAQGSTITTVLPGSTGGSGANGGKPGSVVSGTYVPGGTSAPGGTGSAGVSPPFPTGGLGNSSTNSTGNLPGLLTPTGRTHDYTCHVVAEKHGLGGTFTIFGFLGQNIPSSPGDWLSSPDFCGAHSVFAPLDANTANKMLVSGQIPLTTALVQKIAAGALKSLDETDVLPYLAQNLNWKVATAGGKVVDNSQVPGLTVGAVSQKVMPAANPGTLPTYGQGTLANNVTSGKAGGIQNGMQYNWWDTCASSGHSEL